ncbi:MAG: cell division protein ZapA, partial [Lysobacterales bacterium]
VRILDRDYLVGCPPGEEEALQAAARLLDGRLRELRQQSRTATMERLAVMVALNFAHESLQARQAHASASDADEQLARLVARLDSLLEAG